MILINKKTKKGKIYKESSHHPQTYTDKVCQFPEVSDHMQSEHTYTETRDVGVLRHDHFTDVAGVR